VELRIASGDSPIERTFIDPLGQHLICTTRDGHAFYVHAKTSEAKRLDKLSVSSSARRRYAWQAHTITSCGWNRHLSSEQSTGVMLLGTSTGALIETIIKADAHVMYAKQVRRPLVGRCRH